MVELSEDRVELVRFRTKWAEVAISSLCRLTISPVSGIPETSVQVPQPPQVEYRLMQLGKEGRGIRIIQCGALADAH